MEVLGHFFPDIANMTATLLNYSSQCAKNGVKYICKEPLKGTVIIGTITVVAYNILRTGPVQDAQTEPHG